MAPPMGKIMTVMARTASSNTKSGGKGSTGKARSGETKVMDAVDVACDGCLDQVRT